MAGQGRPHTSRRAFADAGRIAIGWSWRLLLAAHLTCIASAQAAPTTLRLRLAWGGGTQQRWHGIVRVSEGSMSSVEALGIEADEPGSMYLEDTAVIVAARSPRAYDGLDVTITAELSSKLL